MLTETMFETRDQMAELASRLPFEPVETDGVIFAETSWREPKETPGTATGSEITLSRWSATRGQERTESATTPDHCHVVALALRATRMSIWAQSKPLFQGSVPPGTILVSAPGQQLRARITPAVRLPASSRR